MKIKKFFAAAALAAGMAFSGAAHAGPNEMYMPGDLERPTATQPQLDQNGDIVGIEDTQGDAAPVRRTVNACIKGPDGSDYTLKLGFFLMVSATDLKIDPQGKPTLNDVADELAQKFPPDKVQEAVDFIQEAWQKATDGIPGDKIIGNDPEFAARMQEMLSDLFSGARLKPGEPSFEEKTGVSILPAQVAPAGLEPGCKP
jgi:hypothetical protein